MLVGSGSVGNQAGMSKHLQVPGGFTVIPRMWYWQLLESKTDVQESRPLEV